ncbi:MAG: DHH family phosphoesterase [Bacilli bacterium]|nr:DHH family phosphoesterase [Bacilli bacterium]
MEINYLKKYKKIMVIGHNKPDPDSMISSKLMADILSDAGINASYAILEKDLQDLEVKKVVKDCLDYQPFVIKEKDIPNYKYFLVDHNDISQSINNKTLVVGAVDHHPDSKSINNAIFMEVCSTAIGIYLLFKGKYKFNEIQKQQIYHATLADSSYGYNSRYKDSDKEVIRELGFNPDFSDAFLKYFTPTNLTDKEIAFTTANHKNYLFGDIKFESTIIEALDFVLLEEYKIFIKNGTKNLLGIWVDYNHNKTYMFFKYNDLYFEKKYDIIASRSIIILKNALEFLERNGLNV